MSRGVIEELKGIIVQELDVHLKKGEISEDASFFEDGLGIDSIAIVELIALVEERFRIQFSDADLVPSSFQNLRVLGELISEKQKASSGPSLREEGPRGS
jgi:acyl carrier protein